MTINFFSEDVTIPKFPKIAVKNILKQISKDKSVALSNVNIIFCSDEHLLDINIKYLDHDYYTDIITFDYDDVSPKCSDIFISIDRVTENAATNNTPFINELYRIMCHGLLHICGHSDSTPDEKAVMTQNEDYYLSKILSL